MSVYIKGMGMPTNCAWCRFLQSTDPIPKRELFCGIDTTNNIHDYKPYKGCPLIPVPEHGDLIDKSGVEVLSWTEDPEKDFADGVLFVLDKLDELPVIIQAEGDDYEAPAKEGEG